MGFTDDSFRTSLDMAKASYPEMQVVQYRVKSPGVRARIQVLVLDLLVKDIPSFMSQRYIREIRVGKS